MSAFLILLLLGPPAVDTRSVAQMSGQYVERYFEMFPGRATEAGRHDRDGELEDLTKERRDRWIAFNRAAAEGLRAALRRPGVTRDDRLDAELLQREIERQLHEFAVLRRPERDPLFWTNIVANSVVFLLVREDHPRGDRMASARKRVAALPRLALQAERALGAVPPSEIAPELCAIAAGQARASARFYREGFPALYPRYDAEAVAGALRTERALERLAGFLEKLGGRATGSPRLRDRYAETLRIATGEKSSAELLKRAEGDLAAKRREAAAYGRSVWAEVLPGEAPPADASLLLSRLFARVARDRSATTEAFVDDYRRIVTELDAFLRARDVVTLPDPLTLRVDRSPAFFVGQSVGGVYPAGPYAPGADTLWYLPTPPDSATPEAREGFFRDFNHHFNVMITSHEILPGHYQQLKRAAQSPRKLRALFPDGVYVEGWGTFCERLMLDLGWGGPLDRLAHLKKQMENIARAIVDVRVHTGEMRREDVIRFVKEEALQDDQFASNMWTRSITSPTQIATYYLGYSQVRGLFDDARAARGPRFSLREFMDGMMAEGPVPVRHYRERMRLESRSASRAPAKASALVGIPRGPVRVSAAAGGFHETSSLDLRRMSDPGFGSLRRGGLRNDQREREAAPAGSGREARLRGDGRVRRDG